MWVVSDTLMDEKINALVPTHPPLRQAQCRLSRCLAGGSPRPPLHRQALRGVAPQSRGPGSIGRVRHIQLKNVGQDRRRGATPLWNPLTSSSLQAILLGMTIKTCAWLTTRKRGALRCRCRRARAGRGYEPYEWSWLRYPTDLRDRIRPLRHGPPEAFDYLSQLPHLFGVQRLRRRT